MDDFNIDEILLDIENDMILESKENQEELENIETENLNVIRDDNDFKVPRKKGGNEVSEKIEKSIERSLFKKDNFDLSKNQLVTIELLLKGVSPTKIAKKLNISRRVIYKWQKEDSFVKMMEKTKKEYITSFQQHIMASVPKAISTLVDVLNDEYASNKDKISASKAILDISNIKSGGLKEDEENKINPNKTQIVLINPLPPVQNKPKENKVEKVEEVKSEELDFNLDDIIDVEIKEKND